MFFSQFILLALVSPATIHSQMLLGILTLLFNVSETKHYSNRLLFCYRAGWARIQKIRNSSESSRLHRKLLSRSRGRSRLGLCNFSEGFWGNFILLVKYSLLWSNWLCSEHFVFVSEMIICFLEFELEPYWCHINLTEKTEKLWCKIWSCEISFRENGKNCGVNYDLVAASCIDRD
jgi:hypothetical protein